MEGGRGGLGKGNQVPQRSNRVLASTAGRHARARSFVHDASDQRAFRPTTLNTGWRGAIRQSSDSGVLCCYAVEELPVSRFPAWPGVTKLPDPNRLRLTTEAPLGRAGNATIPRARFWSPSQA